MVPKSEYAKVFANNLRRIMHERGKNGADMARYLGVGKSRVSSWMNAQHIPRPDMVDKMCAYLNCTRTDLMEENGVKHGATVTKEQAELVRLAMHGRADNVHLILEVFRRMGGRTRTEPYVYRVGLESCQNSCQITPTIPVYPRCYNREPLPV